MTHHHHHDHDHCHSHHHHDHDEKAELSLEDKLIKLFEHWIQHNISHAETYREWAEKADMNRLKEIGGALDAAADMTVDINRKLEEALAFLKD